MGSVLSAPDAASRQAGIVRAGVTAGMAVVVIAAAAWFLLQQVDAQEVRRTLGGLRPSVLAGVVALECVAFASFAQVYRTTHRVVGGTIRRREALAAAMGAFTLTQLLPGGGSAGALYVAQRLRRAGASTGTAAATVVLTGLVMMGTLGMVVGVTAGVLAVVSGRHVTVAVVSLSTTAVVALTLVAIRGLLARPGPRERLVALAARMTRRSEMVASSWSASLGEHSEVLRDPRVLLRPAAWSAAKWLLDAVVLAVIADALGAGAPAPVILVALGVANLVAALPLTPGGIGLVEAGMTGALVGFGVDPVPASLTAVSYRVLAQWLPVAVALPVLARGMFQRSRVEEAT